MQAHRYDVMMPMILSGKLRPELLIGNEISLEESIDALMAMDEFQGTGTTVVTEF
jgi:alcohol dehydrogenase